MVTLFNNQVSKIITVNELCSKLHVLRFDKGSYAPIFSKNDLVDKLGDKEIGEILQGTRIHPNSTGDDRLVRHIQDIELKTNKRRIAADQIGLTNGALSGLYYTLGLLCSAGDRVLVNDLCFEGIVTLIKSLNLKTVFTNFQERIALEKVIIESKPKVIIVNSPENPSGRIYSSDFFANLNYLANKYEIFVICDEVNNENIYIPYTYVTPNSFISKDRLITINSFTKNYFFPGIRLGWVVGERRFIKQLNNCIVVSQVGISVAGQILARILIDSSQKKIQKVRKELQRKKDFIESMLVEEKFDYMKPIMGGTVVFLHTGVDSKKLFQYLLDTYKIGVIPGGVFGNKWKNWIRLGFSSLNESKIHEGIVKIKKAIQEVK